MTLDEFEAIRLIDYEGLSQQDCAERMGVSRATAQAIYGSARAKLAQCVVDARELRIEGGECVVCEGRTPCGCARPCLRGARGEAPNRATGGEQAMRIAVPYENGTVFQHFGHTARFAFYDVVEGKVACKTVMDTNGSGHGALAGLLSHNHVDTLICGGIGAGAQQALAEAGIRLYGGVAGDADAAVEALLTGNLQYDPAARCDHHDHEHGGATHACGEHGCGQHHHC